MSSLVLSALRVPIEKDSKNVIKELKMDKNRTNYNM
jgi:hypothetical protein